MSVKEKLLAAARRKTDEVELEGVGSVTIRELSASDYVGLMDAPDEEGFRTISTEKQAAQICQLGLIDGEGLMFASVDELADIGDTMLLYQLANKIIALGHRETEKNSETAPDGLPS